MQTVRNSTDNIFKAFLPVWKVIGRNTFRRIVISKLMQEFDITLAAAATHYNASLKRATLINANAVCGLHATTENKILLLCYTPNPVL